jgi:integrase
MMAIRKRGRGFHADWRIGEVRVRGSLGTRNRDGALSLAHQLETALSEGGTSVLWPKLRDTLPQSTYRRFADVVGVKDRTDPIWTDLANAFKTHLEQQKIIGKLQKSTEQRYQTTLREFEVYLAQRQISRLSDITKPVVESFKVWRIERIKRRKFARGGTGLVLDVAILHRVFAFALESDMVAKNPVRMEGRPGENPENGAEPFTAADLARLRDHVADDLLIFLLLRWTGFRGSDAVSLTWREVHFDRKEIERVTQKRKKRVILPIQTELLFALEVEHERRKPEPSDRVLLNPATGKPLTRPRLYHRMLALGKRADVPDAHPHRFRDTLAVDMLTRGASPYDVAKMLGDTIETVEKHYTPFVRELRERVRMILEKNGAGLENLAQNLPNDPQNTVRKPN